MARLLLDTHVLIWAPTGDPRLSDPAREVLQDGASQLFVSAVTAFELAELQRRGRVAMSESLAAVAEWMDLVVLDLPATTWRIAAALPDIHGDPIDRMMIAHAMVDGFTILTADATIRRYPVETLW